jgi:hypothetical protein
MPTRTQAIAFTCKASIFRLQRGLLERPLPHLSAGAPDVGFESVAESISQLYPSNNPAEFALQAGKVQNLRVAARHLDGLRIPAGAVFSFWRQIPRPTSRRGFAAGRELREGCIVPSVGGGLCQLSNAIYDVALQAGCEILERHAHTRRLPGSQAVLDRDATVFWNYVDLRFRASHPLQLSVRLTASELIVRLLSTPQTLLAAARYAPSGAVDLRASAESCETCGTVQCFRHLDDSDRVQKSRTAWIVDTWSPEFADYLTRHRQSSDWLFLPFDSRRWRIGPYHWTSTGFDRVHEARWEVARRSVVSRRLAMQGAARQQALLRLDGALARSFARRIPPDATHVVVSQNLLPYLWREGVLGGRTFDVLMTRLPLRKLHATLDRAAAAHPESPTIADFRADPELVADEAAALAAAEHWITPHTGIAALAACRAELLRWHRPERRAAPAGKRLLFPASTVTRKGAYELRSALLSMSGPPPLVVWGRNLEDADFWSGLPIAPAGEDPFTDVRAVVLPAWVEHQPRRLLEALARGIRVIATPACGLRGIPEVTEVPEGDVSAVAEALQGVFVEEAERPAVIAADVKP